MKCVAFVVILAALSSAKGRVLQDTPTFETVSYDGTYTTEHLGVKHTLAKFPYFDSGSECTAHINVYGLFLDSPFTYGDIQLQILYATPQAQDALKNVLCDLMRTGEYINLFSWEFLSSSRMNIYDDSNGKIILSGSAISLVGLGAGHVRFEGCSC